jgi:hypothetical protein
MKTVELIQQKGSVAIIKYEDDYGVKQCGIIDSNHVRGKTFDVANKVVETATPYGIDWDVVYPNGLVINASDIQEALYGLGIYTLDDIRKNTNGVISAINSILRMTNAKLMNHARTTLEVGGK